MSACGRGICCANEGHEGTCAEASGWDREAEWTPEDLGPHLAVLRETAADLARAYKRPAAEPSVRDRAAEVLRAQLARGLYAEFGDDLPYAGCARRIADALAAAGLLAGEAP